MLDTLIDVTNDSGAELPVLRQQASDQCFQPCRPACFCFMTVNTCMDMTWFDPKDPDRLLVVKLTYLYILDALKVILVTFYMKIMSIMHYKHIHKTF